jgi:hypothetical protein
MPIPVARPTGILLDELDDRMPVEGLGAGVVPRDEAFDGFAAFVI